MAVLAEEYGVQANDKEPLHAGMMRFFAFLICGFIPIFPFLIGSAAEVLIQWEELFQHAFFREFH